MEPGPQRKPKRTYWTTEEAERFSAYLRSCISKAETDASRNALAASGKCGRDWHVLQDTEGKYRFMTYRCGRKFCPSCLMDWSRNLTAKTFRAVLEHDPTDIRHVVLTVPNTPHGGLQERTEALYRARREWTNEGHRKKGRGGYLEHETGIAWKHEVHWSGRAGWHPHLHMLIAAPGGIDCRRGSNARDAWTRITKRMGCEASDAHGLYITSFARQSARGEDETEFEWARRLADEMSKYAAKPLPLRGLSQPLIDELAESSHRRRFAAATGSMQVDDGQGGAAGWHYVGVLSSLGSKHLVDVGKKMDKKRECDPEEGWKIMQAFEQARRQEGWKIPAHLATFVEAAEQNRFVDSDDLRKTHKEAD